MKKRTIEFMTNTDGSNSTEYSEDPYQDGTVPADADMSTSSDGAAAESAVEPEVDPETPEPGTDPITEDEKDRAERHY